MHICYLLYRLWSVETFLGVRSQPITVSIYPTETLDRQLSNANTVCIISFGSLATALIISVAVIIRRNQAKTKDALGQSNGTEGALPMESMYDIIADSSQAISAINTQDNVAYGRIKIGTLK